MRARRAPPPRPLTADSRRVRLPLRTRKLTSLRDSASRSVSRTICPSSVASLRTNLRRAGTL